MTTDDQAEQLAQRPNWADLETAVYAALGTALHYSGPNPNPETWPVTRHLLAKIRSWRDGGHSAEESA